MLLVQGCAAAAQSLSGPFPHHGKKPGALESARLPHLTPGSRWSISSPTLGLSRKWTVCGRTVPVVIRSFTEHVFKAHPCCSMYLLHSFLWLNDVPQRGQTTFCLSTCPLVDLWLSYYGKCCCGHLCTNLCVGVSLQWNSGWFGNSSLLPFQGLPDCFLMCCFLRHWFHFKYQSRLPVLVLPEGLGNVCVTGQWGKWRWGELHWFR